MPCRWCTLSAPEHDRGFVDHQFQEEGTAGEPEPVVRSGIVADLVLRQALVDKGILGPADIRRAERKIRMMSQEAPDGQDDRGAANGRHRRSGF